MPFLRRPLRNLRNSIMDSNNYAFYRYRPLPVMNGTLRKGQCRFLISQDPMRRCLKEFTGPPSRKFCDEHSKTVKFRGKS